MKLQKEEYKLIAEFVEKLVKKLEKSRKDYGMNYMKLNKKGTMNEIEQELIDIVGWGLMFWMKLKKKKVI